MQQDTHYDDVVAEVHGFLRDLARGRSRCRNPRRTGCGWTPESASARTTPATSLSSPRCPSWPPWAIRWSSGPSRKSFIGRLTGAPVDDRLAGTLAALIPAVGLERVVVRVHDPGPASQFLELASG